MIMKKQKSNKGWDFLDACTSEQLNLLKEVLFIDDKKRISIDLTDGEWKRMERKVGKEEIIKALSVDGKNIDYYVYLKHVADILKISNMHSNSFVDYEDAILLACLRQLALKKPVFFKNNYNLAASSAKDVVEELEVRFTTSPALRISLPVVLSAIYAESLSLSKASKNVIDDRLKVLGVLSSFGTYNIASLATVYTIGAAFGPIGLAAASVYHFGKMLFSSNMPKDNIIPVTCILIMLRRQEQDAVCDRYEAFDVVNKLMSDSISTLDRKDVARQKANFLLSIFMIMLRTKDSFSYSNVSKLFSNVDYTKENSLVKGKEMVVKLLLPFADYLVEHFYPLLFLEENVAGYNKFVIDTMSQYGAKSCLVQGFVPNLVNAFSNRRFYVSASDKAIVTLCLELMGRKYSDFCIDTLPENEKFDIAIVKDKQFQNKILSHLYDGGKCVCFMRKNEDDALSVEDKVVKQLKEENHNLKQQLDEYKKKEQFWENATHSFRHSRMTGFLGTIIDDISYISENIDVEQNIADIKEQVKEMKEYVAHFGKFKVSTYNLWDIVRDVFKKTEKKYNVIWNYNCQDKPMVILSKGMFEEWVLENIKSNIKRHAFPEGMSFVNPTVWISLTELSHKYVLKISNNGVAYDGDSAKIFKKGEFYGKTGHTGNGLFYAKMYIDDFLKDGSISLMPATEKCSIGFEIIISK